MNGEFSFILKTTYAPDYVVRKHTHPCYELVYYLSGSGKVTVGERAYSFQPNNFIITAPEEAHDEHSSEAVSVHFLGFTMDGEKLSPGIYTDETGEILQILEEMQRELKEKRPYYQAVLNTLTTKLILYTMRHSPSNPTTYSNFEYIRNYIANNANMHTNIQDIAKHLGYSYDYLRELFMQKQKMSAKAFFMKRKMQNAKEYLRNGNYSIQQIADITGFSSPSHFCNVFKREYGMTPLQYKEQNKKLNLNDNHANFDTEHKKNEE